MKCIIITNNSMVVEKIKTAEHIKADIEFIYDEQCSFLEVLQKVRDYIHMGHILLTHPLSGSIKPYETPFKSVAISKSRDVLDMKSLEIIEQAIQTANKFLLDYKQRNLSQKVYDDFKLIDYSLIKSGVDQIGSNVVIH